MTASGWPLVLCAALTSRAFDIASGTRAGPGPALVRAPEAESNRPGAPGPLARRPALARPERAPADDGVDEARPSPVSGRAIVRWTADSARQCLVAESGRATVVGASGSLVAAN